MIDEAPSSTTTTSAAPVDYAKQYLDLVEPTNCALEKMIAAGEPLAADGVLTEDEWPRVQADLQPAIREYAEATIRFYEGLVATQWPQDVQPAIDELVAQLTTEAGEAMAAADAQTGEAYLAADEQLWSNDENLAGVVRAKLGLESNVTMDDNHCAAST